MSILHTGVGGGTSVASFDVHGDQVFVCVCVGGGQDRGVGSIWKQRDGSTIGVFFLHVSFKKF
jgi:hypothetical protein